MGKSLKDLISENLDKIITYLIGSITSGSLTALITKLFQKTVFGKFNLGIIVLISIGLFLIFITTALIIDGRKKNAKKQYSSILIEIENILDLKRWDNFMHGAQEFKFEMAICDKRDNLIKYFDSNMEFWKKYDKNLHKKIIELKNAFIEMYETLSPHLVAVGDGSILTMDKFYRTYWGTLQATEKEKEFDDWSKKSWKSIENYKDKLNDIVSYTKKKKYNLDNTSWNNKFLKYA